MKYRHLVKEELESLQEEFLKYLIVANITPEKWEILKEEESPEVQKHLEIFSDLVFEKIISDVSYVDKITSNRIEVYQFLKQKAFFYSLENKSKDSQNLTEKNLADLDLETVTILQGEKSYTKERGEEVFAILNNEYASISDGEIFKKIVLLFYATS